MEYEEEEEYGRLQVWGIAPIFTVGTNHKLPSRDDLAKCKNDRVVVNARFCGELGPSIAFLTAMYLKMFECCNALIATHNNVATPTIARHKQPNATN